MKRVIFFRREDTLSYQRASYYKDLLYRALKAGTEIEVAPPKGVKREVFEDAIRRKLEPSGSFEVLGKWGVFDVKAEHCGIEIRVIGRYPYFQALYEQFKYIFQVLQEEGARARPTCGMHIHLLSTGLSEPIPEIILSNIWNFTRRYALALKFIASCGDSYGALCRRRNHNSHVELVKYSSGLESMCRIQEMLRKSSRVPEHQNFLNLQHVRFNEDGNVAKFHLEFRFLDADLCAISVVSKIFLVMAIIMKSIDLSKFGVIHVGEYEVWKHRQRLLDMLSNNDGMRATSDTSRLELNNFEEIHTICHEMLDLLEPSLSMFHDNPSKEILRYLAETPISFMRASGMNWSDIEQTLEARIFQNEIDEFDAIDKKIMKSVEMIEIEGMPSEEEAWRIEVARELNLSLQNLEERLRKINSRRNLYWDKKKGTMLFKT